MEVCFSASCDMDGGIVNVKQTILRHFIKWAIIRVMKISSIYFYKTFYKITTKWSHWKSLISSGKTLFLIHSQNILLSKETKLKKIKRKLCRMLQSKQKGQTFSLPKYITHFIFYNIIVQSFKNRKEKVVFLLFSLAPRSYLYSVLHSLLSPRSLLGIDFSNGVCL